MIATPFRVLKTQTIRPRRTDLFLIKSIIPSRPMLGWGTKQGLERILKGHKFGIIQRILNANTFQSLCAAIGFVEVNWALFEQSLDSAALIIYQSLGGNKIDRGLPRAYSAKSKFLRKAFNKIILLRPLETEATGILDRADKLSRTRHDLTHGVVTHTKARSGRFDFAKIDYVRSGHDYRDFSFHFAAFPALAKELLTLGTDTTLLGIKIFRIEQRLLRHLGAG